MKLNNLAMHILFSLLNGNVTGYELTQSMSKSHVWRSSHQQVYRELTKLDKLGLVMFTTVHQEGKPGRKLYSLTAAGHAAIEAAAKNTTPIISPVHSIRTVMINSGNKKYFETLAEQLKAEILLIKTKMIKEDCPVEHLSMCREIYHHTAELDFCADVLKHLAQNANQKAA
ncbi:PadR family transcriptional regulator [Photobacterium sagamiensis]|uniref:PadR family transcriptional regulator n=1 Tax=Photobacterium sagamiensis TaxID=2910241 RepID=UPI003D0A0B12